MPIHLILLVTGLAVAWFPVETSPLTGVFLALVVLALTPRTIDDLHTGSATSWLPSLLLLLAVAIIAVTDGWDRPNALGELALVISVGALILMASRAAPPQGAYRHFALGLAALSLWALYQVFVGFDQAAGAFSALPPHLQDVADARLASGRAFASLFVPGHLAVLLATALPLLIADVKRARTDLFRWLGLALCLTGLFLTRSSLGIFLAVGAAAVLILRDRSSRFLTRKMLALIPILGGAVLALWMSRPGLFASGPISLRLDNWKTAIWLWSTSPFSGIGFGGYGQASQAVPFSVGNRPLHAHCLPLEWLAEMGPAGLALAGLATLALWRLMARLWPERPEIAVAVAVIPVHNLADFSLYTSGVALPWALLVGWAAALARSIHQTPAASHDAPHLVAFASETGEYSGQAKTSEIDASLQVAPAAMWVRIPALAAAGSALALTVLSTTSVYLQRGAEADDDGARAAVAATSAHRIAPWRPDPMVVLASTALRSDEPERRSATLDLLADGHRLRPHSGLFAVQRSRLALSIGLVPTAVTEAWAANFTQPANAENRLHFSTLLEQLEPERPDGT